MVTKLKEQRDKDDARKYTENSENAILGKYGRTR